MGREARSICGAIAALIALTALGCSSAPRYQGLGAEGDYLTGRDLYERGRYFQSIEVLEAFLSEHPGSARVDDAIFTLGLARKEMGEYLLARQEFDRILGEFPQSENREEAEWQRALTFFESRHPPDRDPEPTEEAVAAFLGYLRHYPKGTHVEEATTLIAKCEEVLAVKEFENGKTYQMLRQWDAAIIYYEKCLGIRSESKVAGEAHARLARMYAKKGDAEMAELWQERLAAYATPARLATYPDLERWLREAANAVEEARRVDSTAGARTPENGTGPEAGAGSEEALSGGGTR